MVHKEFSTTDIVLASYLKAMGNKLIDITKLGNRGTFIFSDIDDQIITDYDLGETRVEPKTLSAEIRALTTAARR